MSTLDNSVMMLIGCIFTRWQIQHHSSHISHQYTLLYTSIIYQYRNGRSQVSSTTPTYTPWKK